MSDKTLVISERWRELDSSFDNPEIVSVWKDVVHEIILDCSRAEAEVAALRAQNADARKAAEWVPIDAEHLPKVGDEVLRNVSNYWVEGISDPECNGWSAKRWKAMGIRAYRPINALPKPVAFKGFSGNLMVFSDSNLLAENCTAPPPAGRGETVNLIGSDFVRMVSDRARRCSQLDCGKHIKKGDTFLASVRDGKIKKIVCSESCRQNFDAEFWAGAAERNHPGKDTAHD
jgi:hypothetical protein